MDFIQVDRYIDLMPPKMQNLYIPLSNIIAFVKYRQSFTLNEYNDLIYKDLTKNEKRSFYSFSKHSEKLIDNLKSEKNFIELDSEFDPEFERVIINPLQINYITDYENISDISHIVSTARCHFVHLDKKENLIAKLDNEMIMLASTPLRDECYVNTCRIHSIETEDYTTIDPQVVDKYLEAIGIADTIQLFHITFDDMSFLTILENPINISKN